jgi:acyl carrier protein
MQHVEPSTHQKRSHPVNIHLHSQKTNQHPQSQTPQRNANDQPTSDSTEEAIIQLLAQTAVMDKRRITPQTELIQLGINSFDFMTVVVRIEEAFNIHIPDDALFNNDMQTVADVVELVKTIEDQPVD